VWRTAPTIRRRLSNDNAIGGSDDSRRTFYQWDLGLFIFGVFLTFGIIAHYCAGSRWPNGELFMQNITLWWACPWTLSVAAVQAGGLGMVAIGLTLMLAARVSSTHPAAEGSTELWLCIVGLLGVFPVGHPGYFVFDTIWPSFTTRRS
jgi:hypothetical protein